MLRRLLLDIVGFVIVSPEFRCIPNRLRNTYESK